MLVSATELRAAYANMVAHYDKRAVTLFRRTVYNKPANPAYNQPIGTRSIMTEIIDPETDWIVGLIHYYELPDGIGLGGSGKADPKRICFDRCDYRQGKEA